MRIVVLSVLLLAVVVAVLITGILWLRSMSVSPASMPQPRQVDAPFLQAVSRAVATGNALTIEGLRGNEVRSNLPEITAMYWGAADWEEKDLLLQLLQDHSSSELEPLFLDALNSPAVESRAVAVSILADEPGLFDSFVVNGFIVRERVDAAVESHRKRHDP